MKPSVLFLDNQKSWKKSNKYMRVSWHVPNFMISGLFEHLFGYERDHLRFIAYINLIYEWLLQDEIFVGTINVVLSGL